MHGFYKSRQNQLLTGVLAGIAQKFSLSPWLVRAVFLALVFFTQVWFLFVIGYFLLAAWLPYKEDEEAKQYGTGPRRRKDAEKL